MIKKSILSFFNLLSEIGIPTMLLKPAAPVFMLHRVYDKDENIGGISVDYLRQCLNYLAKHNYTVLTFDELNKFLKGEKEIPRKSAVFTIDDGFYDHYTNAARVFDEFGYPLNFFLIADFIDGKLWPWDDQLMYAIKQTTCPTVRLELPGGDIKEYTLTIENKMQIASEIREELKKRDQTSIYEWIKNTYFGALEVNFPEDIPSNYKPMSWDNAQDLCRRGHGVYPHTRTHRILSRLSTDEVATEINESIIKLQSVSGDQSNCFAYPTGRPSDYDDRAVEALKTQNCQLAFNTLPGYATRESNPLEIARFSIPTDFTNYLQYLTKFERVKEVARGLRER